MPLIKKHQKRSQAASPAHEEHYDSIADAILRKKKSMSEGGMVESDNEEDESPLSSLNDLNEDAVGEIYDIEDISNPMDSGEHGNDLEDYDSDDMVSKIRQKIKARSKK